MKSKKEKYEKLYFFEKKLQKAMHTALCIAGFVVTPFLGLPSALETIAGYAFIAFEIENRMSRNYDDLFIHKIMSRLGQKGAIMTKGKYRKQVREILKGKSVEAKKQDISALMVEQLVLFFDKEKRRLAGKKTKAIRKLDGTNVFNFSGKYKTLSHSINIGTLVQLHKMGYIHIKSIKYKKTHDLHSEKFSIDSMLDGNIKAILRNLFYHSKAKDEKKTKYDMYKATFYLTDKQFDFDKLIDELEDSKRELSEIGSEISIDVLSHKEKKTSPEERDKCQKIRMRHMKKHTLLAKYLMKDGLAMIAVEKNGISYRYVDKASKDSILYKHNEKKSYSKPEKSYEIDDRTMAIIQNQSQEISSKYQNVEKKNSSEPVDIDYP